MDQNCAHCHGAEGVGPEWVVDYDRASEDIDLILTYLDIHRMPPPASDPSCRDYYGSERLWLSDEDRAVFGQWKEDGTPLGEDDEPRPSAPDTLQRLENPNHYAQIASPYTVNPSEDNNEYRCFVLEMDTSEDQWATGFEVLPGDPAVTHHAVLMLDPAGDPSASYGLESGLDEFDCREQIFGGEGWKFLYGWAPGMSATLFPEGKGMGLPAGSKLVLQMHYYATAPTTDQTQVAISTVDSVEDPIFNLALGPLDFEIPAGDSEYKAVDELANLSGDYTLYGMFPHMHWLGARFAARVEHQDQDDDCLVEGDWDFENQMTYQFKEPARWSIGDTLHVSCVFDNSNGDTTVGFGEATDEEMCLFFSYVSRD